MAEGSEAGETKIKGRHVKGYENTEAMRGKLRESFEGEDQGFALIWMQR